MTTLELHGSLPPTLPVGMATAAFLWGTCEARKLRVRVEGADPVDAELAGGDFWAVLPIEARLRPGEIGVEAIPDGGQPMRIGAIDVVERRASQGPGAGTNATAIAICMATYDPDLSLFATQIESLRAQRDSDWICLVSDDCSPGERYEQMLELLGGDPRFVVSRSEQRLGFYRNFERALEMVPAESELVALCDQDDRWHPDKLATLRHGLGRATLVYGDQRLIDADGRVLRETMWEGRRNNHTDLVSLLVANTITGAAALMRREVLDRALPFPDTPGYQFHDHWLGLVALALGPVAYVDRPLYDYVQHGGAVFGDVTHGSRRRPEYSLLERWRAMYFYGYLARAVQARVVLARCEDVMEAGKRRALRRFLASERSAGAFAWLILRSIRALAGRNETLGSELELAQGIIWRWLNAIRPPRRGVPRGLPPLAAFDQKRMRRWRASIHGGRGR